MATRDEKRIEELQAKSHLTNAEKAELEGLIEHIPASQKNYPTKRAVTVSGDEARIAELKAKTFISPEEERELQVLEKGLPAERTRIENERKEAYARLDYLSEDQWKAAVELLRTHGYFPEPAPVLKRQHPDPKPVEVKKEK